MATPQLLPQPPLSNLHPPERRPPPIDLQSKVSDLYNKAQRANDDGTSSKRVPPEQVGPQWTGPNATGSWRTYTPPQPKASPAFATGGQQVATIPGVHFASSGTAPTPAGFYPNSAMGAAAPYGFVPAFQQGAGAVPPGVYAGVMYGQAQQYPQYYSPAPPSPQFAARFQYDCLNTQSPLANHPSQVPSQPQPNTFGPSSFALI